MPHRSLCCKEQAGWDKLHVPSVFVRSTFVTPSATLAFTLTCSGSVAKSGQFGASTAPAPTTSRNRQTEDLEVTVATQDQTISTLQSQFSSLRSSHEAHVSSLADAHAAELASLRNYTKALEEQLAQRPSLHHGECKCVPSCRVLFVPTYCGSRQLATIGVVVRHYPQVLGFSAALARGSRTTEVYRVPNRGWQLNGRV
jgi:uncharacterized coiled-coil protein SlyX